MLEECGMPYTVFPVALRQGEQYKPEFLKISPNNRIPAIVDRDGPGGAISVFESGAILLYLARKNGKLLPKDLASEAQVLRWSIAGGILFTTEPVLENRNSAKTERHYQDELL